MTVRTEPKAVRVRSVVAAALMSLAVPGLTVASAVPASAQAAVAAPGAFHGRADHVEGRIAYLRAELKITDAEAPQWDAVAAAMRRSAAAERALHDEMHAQGGKPMTAVERLALRDKVTALHAENARAFTAAFTALYARMGDDQKKAADQLLSPRRHRRL
jgi:hypothetical protein